MLKIIKLQIAALVAVFFSGAVHASPPPNPIYQNAGCEKIYQNNGEWIASACPVGIVGNRVASVEIYYWGYLADSTHPFDANIPASSIQAKIQFDNGEFVNTALDRNSKVYYSRSPSGREFYRGTYLTALPENKKVNLKLYFEYNGSKHDEYGKKYEATVQF